MRTPLPFRSFEHCHHTNCRAYGNCLETICDAREQHACQDAVVIPTVAAAERERIFAPCSLAPRREQNDF